MHGNVMIIVKPTVGQVILNGLAGIKCGAKSFIVLVLLWFRYLPHGYSQNWKGSYVKKNIKADKIVSEDYWFLIEDKIIVTIIT